MNEEQTLDRIEHHLLSMQCDDIEPLFILYADTTRDIEEANLDLVLRALLKLVNLGFSRCIIKEGGEWKTVSELTLNNLEKRFHGQSEAEKKEYPMHVNEYYFEITDEGRIEEAKDIYDKYYPD